jgi:hypothetical protein
MLRPALVAGCAYAAIYLALVAPYCFGTNWPWRFGEIGVWIAPLTYLGAWLISFGRPFPTLLALLLGGAVSAVLAACGYLLCAWMAGTSKWLLLLPLALFVWWSSTVLPPIWEIR